MKATRLFHIDELAQDFTHAPEVVWKEKDVMLMYDYEIETGGYKETGLTFINTIEYKHTSEKLLTNFISEAYNAVVEIDDPDEINKVIASIDTIDNKLTFKHYYIYFDGYGTYEFISTDIVRGIKE